MFTVGDLVKMKHWVLDHYVQLGLVKQHHGCLIEVCWVWYAYDGNNDLVCVPKKQTVNPSFLKKNWLILTSLWTPLNSIGRNLKV